MSAIPSYDELLRKLINRIINSPLASRVVMPLLTAGLSLVMLYGGNIFRVQGVIAWGPFQVTLDNEPEWLLVALGVLFIFLALTILYAIHIRSQASPYEKIKALALACRTSSVSNPEIQQQFKEVYRYTPSAAAARFIMALDDSDQAAIDFRYARNWVKFEDGHFKPANQANLERAERRASISYFLAASGVLLALVALPLVYHSEPVGEKWGTALLGLFTAVLSVLGCFSLGRVRDLNCAIRLLALRSLSVADAASFGRVLAKIDFSVLEHFFEQGHAGYFYNPLLDVYAEFHSVYRSANFNIAHAKVRSVLQGFHRAWQDVQSFGTYFFDTANPSLSRFDFPMDLPRSVEQEAAFERYLISVQAFEDARDELLEVARYYLPADHVEDILCVAVS